MNKFVEFYKGNKRVALFATVLAVSISLILLFFGLSMLAFISAVLLVLLAAAMLVSIAVKDKLALFLLAPFVAIIIGLLIANIFWGAESFAKRLFYNLAFLIVPIAGVYILFNNQRFPKIASKKFTALITLSAVSVACITYVFMLPLRYKPNVAPMTKGYSAYFASEKQAKPNAPNVLLINTDIDIDSLPCYGGNNETPNICALAEDGMVFLNYFSQTNKEFALLTGRYPERGGLNNAIYPTKTSALSRYNNAFLSSNNVNGILGDEISLPAILQAGGYSCGCFGIWNLGDYGQYLPTKHGFDNFYGSYFAGSSFAIVNEKEGKAELISRSKDIDSITIKAQEYISQKADTKFFIEYSMPLQPFAGKNSVSAQDILAFDKQVGALIDTLKTKDLYDTTLIILSGGTQDSFGRAPFIVTYINGNLNSGNYAGRELTAPIATIDVYPTVLNFAGLTKPSDREIDGVDLYNLLKAFIYGDSKLHSALYFFKGGKPVAILKRESIDSKNYDFLYYTKAASSSRTEALFNLTLDRQEKENLATQEQNIAQSLSDNLKDYARTFSKNKRGAA